MSAGVNEEKQNSNPSDIREKFLKELAEQDFLSIPHTLLLIQEYIFDVKSERVVITDISNMDLFEKAATIATNYYLRK